MTSEVVLLNKEAVVIAADSAVTVGRDPHPRYSKSANKIFDASACGNLAIAIFSGAEIDGVPWELAIKQFRSADGATPQRAAVADYIPAVIQFLQGNSLMFPAGWLQERLKTRLAVAGLQVLDDVKVKRASLLDSQLQAQDRKALWDEAVGEIKATLSGMPLAPGLSQQNYDDVLGQLADLASAVHAFLPAEVGEVVNTAEFFELAVEYAFRAPHHVFNSTGVIFAGYGAEQVFPAFHSVTVYGHIGSEICYSSGDSHVIDHTNGAWIQPFAKFSMIQRFTDGFDYKQRGLLLDTLSAAANEYTTQLEKAGATIPPGVAQPLIEQIAKSSVEAWQRENYKENFHPLRRVLNSLSVQEMAELAETLLVLESLRERVTSPSETVGGPVDVAAITKTDGLVWIRRKHYFDSRLNLRYLERLKNT